MNPEIQILQQITTAHAIFLIFSLYLLIYVSYFLYVNKGKLYIFVKLMHIIVLKNYQERFFSESSF